MAELSGLDMVREIIGQINNLRRLVTINGKKYKWDGKKYVRAVDGKTFTKKQLVSFVKDEKFEAPKTPKVRKRSEELKTTKITKDSKGRRVVDPEGNKVKITKRDIKGDITKKAQGVKSKALKIGKQGLNKGNQVLQNAKLRIMQPGGQAAVANRAQQLNRYIRGLTPGSVMGGVTKGAAGLVADNLMMSGANQLIDRGARALAGKNQMSLQDFRTARDTGKLKGTLRNRLGINKPVGRNWIEPPYGDGKQPNIVFDTAPPNANTDTSKVTRETNPTQAKVPVKKKTSGFNPNAPDMGYSVKKKTKNNEPLKIAGKLPSPIQKKLLKAGFTHDELTTLVNRYNKKYRSKRGW